jgi:Winged helix-turn helix
VVLSEEERARLHTMIGRGVAQASVLTHARILLKANQGEAGPGWTDAAIAVALEVNPATVARVRRQYVTAGLDAALHRKPPAREYHRRPDGEQEARLVAPGRAARQDYEYERRGVCNLFLVCEPLRGWRT